MLYTFRGLPKIGDVLADLVEKKYAPNRSAAVRKAICEAAEREGIKV